MDRGSTEADKDKQRQRKTSVEIVTEMHRSSTLQRRLGGLEGHKREVER